VSGSTAKNGLIEQVVPAQLTQATLDVSFQRPGGQCIRRCWILKLGHLDDIAEPTGIQARLNNLGFDCGTVDGIIGPRTESAIRHFQKWAGLHIDGIAGPKTQAKLKSVHGC
jgi:N-acetylmuramoyl-L-alanine amidase